MGWNRADGAARKKGGINMKKEIKGFVLGVLSTVVVGSGVALAAGQFVSIDVVPNNVSIAVNGHVREDIDSFTYNDRTYVQLRPVLENIDGGVEYEADTKTVQAYNRFRTLPDVILTSSGNRYKQIIQSDPYDPDEINNLETYVDTDILYELGLIFDSNASDRTGLFAYSVYSPLY